MNISFIFKSDSILPSSIVKSVQGKSNEAPTATKEAFYALEAAFSPKEIEQIIIVNISTAYSDNTFATIITYIDGNEVSKSNTLFVLNGSEFTPNLQQ